MRVVVVVLALLLFVAAGLGPALDSGQFPWLGAALAPYADLVRANLPWAILGLAALLLLILLFWRPQAAAPAAAPVVPAAPARKPPSADAEVVSFLGLLQEKGRFVDFLMGDVAGFSDAEVGAAGRVMHEGCKAVLTEHFGVKPLREEGEGAKITVPQGYAPDDYRLVGRISGEAPFKGTLIHHGWRVEWVKLPRLIRANPDKLPAIAPAEVELG
jgi:hypothetical protein